MWVDNNLFYSREWRARQWNRYKFVFRSYNYYDSVGFNNRRLDESNDVEYLIGGMM